MIHLLGIALLSLYASVRLALAASLVSIALFDFLYITPQFTFAWSDIASCLTFAGMLAVALIVSTLSERVRHSEREARAAAHRSLVLRELDQELSRARDPRQLIAIGARHLKKLFQAIVIISLQTADGSLEFGDDADRTDSARNTWLRGESTRPGSRATMKISVPLIGSAGSNLGVIALEVPTCFERGSNQDSLLSACADQLASAFERVQLADAVQRTRQEAESERLRSSLLSAVSHDLKTPLATMIAAGSTLIARSAEISEPACRDLLSSMVHEGERLHRMIHNLLSITRLESSVELRRTPESLEDIVQSAIGRFEAQFPHAQAIETQLSADLPLVIAEPLLIEQVLLNLLENATRYAGPRATIAIRAFSSDAGVKLQVSDDGSGIPEDERERVFERFYRGRQRSHAEGGVGLGLTLCRAIVRAHGGQIHARSSAAGGALIEFTLPTLNAPVDAVGLALS